MNDYAIAMQRQALFGNGRARRDAELLRQRRPQRRQRVDVQSKGEDKQRQQRLSVAQRRTDKQKHGTDKTGDTQHRQGAEGH